MAARPRRPRRLPGAGVRRRAPRRGGAALPSATGGRPYCAGAGHPAPSAVRAALASSYGRRLCVFRSPYRAGQLDAAHERLGDLVASSDLFEGGGIGVGANGLPEVSGGAVILTTQLADVAGEFPPGLVRFDAWLTKTG